jgi:hypothetical protein
VYGANVGWDSSESLEVCAGGTGWTGSGDGDGEGSSDCRLKHPHQYKELQMYKVEWCRFMHILKWRNKTNNMK